MLVALVGSMFISLLFLGGLTAIVIIGEWLFK